MTIDSRPEQPADPQALRRLEDRYTRLQADLANLRRNQASEVDRARRRERERLIGAWLDVVDSLELAIAQHPGGEAEGAGPEDPWLAGTRGVLRRAEEVLRRQGVRAMGAELEPFDPDRHEAIGAVPATLGIPDGTVARVQRRGYVFDDGRVLRPARVWVAKRVEVSA